MSAEFERDQLKRTIFGGSVRVEPRHNKIIKKRGNCKIIVISKVWLSR